jgi:cytochrome c-type biogenesis protein CcmF
MPWLVGTALLHSAVVVEKRDSLKSWTILLAIIAFSLSLIGTFLVRSGVLTSVHAFAVDPARGAFILALLAIVIGGSLTLYAVRAPALKAGGLFAPISREGALVLNNLLLSTAAATVFVGTLYPLFLDAIGGPKLSVGKPFFDATFVPLMWPLCIALVAGPMLAWKRGDLLGALVRLKVAFGAALVTAAVAAYLVDGGPLLAVAGVGLAAWLVVGSLTEWVERTRLSWSRMRHLPRSAWGTTLAHLGVGLFVLGVSASAWQSERIEVVKPGDTIPLAGYTLRFEGMSEGNGPNYAYQRGTVTVLRGDTPVATLAPEKRFYPVARTSRAEAAIRTTGLADLYLALGDPDPNGGIVLRAWHNPLVPWIWFGAIVMAAGGLVSLTDRRFRVGAPARKPALKPAPAHPA